MSFHLTRLGCHLCTTYNLAGQQSLAVTAMAALQCTCSGRGQACNGGERVGGGDWDYYVAEGMASRVVDYLVGKPGAG